MKIDAFKPIRRTDVQGAQPWIDKIKDPIEAQVKSLTTALQGQIGPDNMNVEIRDVRLRHEQPAEIVLTTLRGKPKGGTLLETGLFQPYSWCFEVADLRRVRVMVSWKTAPVGEIDTRWKIEGA